MNLSIIGASVIVQNVVIENVDILRNEICPTKILQHSFDRNAVAFILSYVFYILQG